MLAAADFARQMPFLTQSSGAGCARGTFPDECCFQVIYFVSNISFSAPSEQGPTAAAESVWLTYAVKNAWADWRQTRHLQG
jgi:hypothetical protein